MGDKDMSQEGSVSPDTVPLTRAGTEEDAGGALMFMCSRAGAYTSLSIYALLRVLLLTSLRRWKYTDLGWRTVVNCAWNLLALEVARGTLDII